MSMTSIDEQELLALQKDADDNRAVMRALKWITFIIIFSVFMVTFGCDAISRRQSLQRAYSEVEIREIQSEGMEFDDYITWLEAKGD